MNLECWSVLEDRQTSVPITRTRLLNNVLVQSCYGNNVQFRLLDKIRRYITDWYWAVDEGSMSCRHNSDQTRYTPPQSGTVHQTQHHQLLILWRQEQEEKRLSAIACKSLHFSIFSLLCRQNVNQSSWTVVDQCSEKY